MKEYPILFSSPMICALLEGRKTQTRRVVAPRGLGFIDCCCCGTEARWIGEGDRWHCGTCGGGARLTPSDVEYVRCPYGAPGDRLWCRETWAPNDGSAAGYLYRSDYHGASGFHKCDLKTGIWTHSVSRWRPSIHMPRAASRILLEITDVRVERLQGISIEDAKAEGAWDPDASIVAKVAEYFGEDVLAANPRKAFRMLWESINGADSWAANPFVWAVSFRRVEAPTA